MKCLICGVDTENLKFGGKYFYCGGCDFYFANPERKHNKSEKIYDDKYLIRNKVKIIETILNLYQLIDYGHVKKILKNRKSILDVGCGNGKFLSLLNEEKKNLFGIDISKYAIEAAKINVPSGKFTASVLEKNTFKENQFDAVTSFHVLEHLEDPKIALKNIYRILKQKGVLVLRVPNIASWEANVTGENWFHFDYPYHVNHFSPSALNKLLTDCGFRKISFNYELWEYKQTFLYSLLWFLGIKNMPLFAKVLILPLQVITIPLAWLISKISKNNATVEVIAFK